MAATPIYALPYPASTDPADVPTDMQELADRIEAVLGPAGVMRVVGDSLLASPAATLDFTGIAGTFKHLLIRAAVRSDAATQAQTLLVRFNGDAGANYDYGYILALGTAVSGADTNAVTSISTAIVPAASSPANVFAAVALDVPAYAGAGHKSLDYVSHGKAADAINKQYMKTGGGVWRNVAAITRVTLLLDAGNFAAGSRATIYALP